MFYCALSTTSAFSGKHELGKDLTEMRPELQEIFGCAVAGWLNFVTHRHFVLQQKIIIELTNMAPVPP